MAQTHGLFMVRNQKINCFTLLKILSAKHQLYFVYYCYTPQAEYSKMEKYGLPTKLAEGRPSPESSPQGTLILSKFYGFYTFTWLFMVFFYGFLWFFMVCHDFLHILVKKIQLSQLLLYFLHKKYKTNWDSWFFLAKKLTCLSCFYTFLHKKYTTDWGSWFF